jgi:protein-arginine kinase activator protein McsA
MIKLPNKSISQFEKFISADPKTFYTFTLKKIGKAIDENKKDVILMILESNKIASVKREHFPKGLEKALEYFVEVEDYESATLCRDYLNKLKIEEVIQG